MDPSQQDPAHPQQYPEQPSASQPNAEIFAALEHRIAHLEQTVSRLADLLAINPAEAAPTAPSSPLAQQQRPDPTAPPPIPAPSEPSTPLAAYAAEAPARAAKDSLEDRLGAQVFNRIGIVALLLGATWFLKLAMDNHWIGPLGRVLVGLLAGTGLVLWSERFRRQGFAAFSYSLKAIGSGVLYLSLWAAFQLYHLLPAPAAFALMLAVTAWNAFMAWSQRSELLAVYALLGAFATPLLLSTGGNHQVFLFSYLLAIDLVTVLLVRAQQRRPDPWPLLLFLAFPATVAYFAGWFASFYTADQVVSTGIFLALFFAVFVSVPLAPSSSEDPEDSPEASPESGSGSDANRRLALPIIDVLLPLINAAFTAIALSKILDQASDHAARPWFALLLAAVYLGLLRLPQRATARAIHLSLAVVFLTIAIPLKASGAAISLAWMVEGVMLLWAANHLATDESNHNDPIPITLRRLATAALQLGFLGLILHPLWIYPSPSLAFFNGRFGTALTGILAFAAAVAIALMAMRREVSADPAADPETFPTWLQIAGGSVIALNLLAIEAVILEIGTVWYRPYANPLYAESRLETALSISAFLALYGAALLSLGFVRRIAFLRWQGLALLLVAIVKVFLHDISHLSAGYRVVSFLGLGALLMAVSFAYQKDWLSLREQAEE